jgi:competence protein ComEC
MKYKLVFLGSIFFVMCGLLIYVNQPAISQPYSIQVSFIDVGEGDSALVQNSDGYNILIDGGQESEGQTVLAYLRNNGVYTLNAVIASHADSDHIGGLISVLEATDISVDSVIYNGYPGNTQTWNEFILAVADEGLTLESAQFPGELTWGTTKAYILNPISNLVNPDTNDVSIVLLIDQIDTEFLFPGDIDSAVESEIMARGTPIAADILKVAHHGSDYSTSIEFLNTIQPYDSVLSVGPNPYGHPGVETLGRLQSIGSNIWRTDIHGTILITSDDGTTYQIIPSSAGEYLFLPLIINW